LVEIPNENAKDPLFERGVKPQKIDSLLNTSGTSVLPVIQQNRWKPPLK
jgi:hypothetical protein